MIPYEDWKIVYEDKELDVRIDPQELEGYGLHIKGTENFVFLPRGTLKNIAKSNRNSGKISLDNLMPYTLKQGNFFKGTSLTSDSLITAITKAYLKEEERYQQSLIQEKS